MYNISTRMDGKTILFFIFILLLIYIVISYAIRETSKLTDVQSADTMVRIDAGSLEKNDVSNPSNFTYSIWFYINDWNYRYGEPKVIFGRMGKASGDGKGAVEGVNGLEPCPSVVLGPVENNILVSLACYPGTSETSENNSTSTSIVHTCSVANVPLQKWVNLLLSVYNRTMDIYIDGKLVNTCLLPGVAYVNQNAPIYVTPKGGFSGWTAKLQYWAKSTDPQEAWNIYVKGYGPSWLSNIFGQYKVQVTLLKNGTETSTVEI